VQAHERRIAAPAGSVSVVEVLLIVPWLAL
jgi:hypothetical protein